MHDAFIAVLSRAVVIGGTAGMASLFATFVVIGLIGGGQLDGTALIFISVGMVCGAVVGALAGGVGATAGLLTARVTRLFTQRQKVATHLFQLAVFAFTGFCIAIAAALLIGWWGMLIGAAAGLFAAIYLGPMWDRRVQDDIQLARAPRA